MKKITKRKAKQIQKMIDVISVACEKVNMPNYYLCGFTAEQTMELDNVLKSYGLKGLIPESLVVAECTEFVSQEMMNDDEFLTFDSDCDSDNGDV